MASATATTLAEGQRQLSELLRQWAAVSNAADERSFKSFLVRAGLDSRDIDRLLIGFHKSQTDGTFDVDQFVRWLFLPGGSCDPVFRDQDSAWQLRQKMGEEIYAVPLLRTPPEDEHSVAVMTWNIAAINNNPFEYWLTVDDPAYLDLMDGVEALIEDPGARDILVSEVFTGEMFSELRALMDKEHWENLDTIEEMWCTDYRRRSIVSGYLKDMDIGAKRLISMPDRLTNTINVVTLTKTEYKPPPAFRPTVINNFEGDMSSVSIWWDQWKRFMFTLPLTIKTKTGTRTLRPCEMMERIPHAKYPKISEEEERVSVPLQVLCLAIFDAILVHIMTLLSPQGIWQNLKGELCERLYRQKHRRTAEILAKTYQDVEIICLQEVAAVFVEVMRRSASTLAETHHVVLPEKLDGKRDQNSLIMLRKDRFLLDGVVEVTAEVTARLEGGMAVCDGDLLAITCKDVWGNDYFIVSFHGDTDGKLSIPIVKAICATWKEKLRNVKSVILGLDANVYFPQTAKGRQTLDGFLEALGPLGFTTCWGDRPDPRYCRTTCSARTFLQPQLNKAVKRTERGKKGDNSPKDIIVFFKDQFETEQPPTKDNTGQQEYIENTMFPTPLFPSDHGILAAVLKRRCNPQGD